jgi:hypothetical protein
MPKPDQGSPAPSAPPAPGQLVIDPSKLKAQLSNLAVLFAFAVSFFTAVAGFVAKRDLAGFIVYVQHEQTIAGLSGVFAIGLLVWRQIVARQRKDTETALAITSPIGELTRPAVIKQGSIVDQAIKAAGDAGTVAIAPPVTAAAADYAVPSTDPNETLPDYAR